MIIIASHNGDIGIDAAMHSLKDGGSALDASRDRHPRGRSES